MIAFRNFARNCQPVFYKNYLGEQEIIDEAGNSTGVFAPTYSELKSVMLCVSPNKGTSEVEQFGSFADYDRTATSSNPNLDLDENSVLWVDNADTDGPHNYIVTKKAPWFNSTQLALKKVEVSYAENQSQP